MGKAKPTKSKGWKFDNSYAKLPEHYYTRIEPQAVRKPQLVVFNHELADELGLSFSSCASEELAQYFSGNKLPEGAEPIAQAYAGHQFGHFTMLGDGRAHLIGEHVTPAADRVDVQFKGSGKTPYGRRGDGRAALGPMLREYIISEAMHALGIPTTRSLAVVTTGEPVYRETVLPGAVLTRIASSHIRVGTFEYVAAQKDVESLQTLADYTIDRHYPELKDSATPYLDLILSVMQRQIALVVNWLRVGFIHGVMNTDNTAISGETIDYGPCAFMDSYDPKTVFSSIDYRGRYAYANQPHIVQWNIARFAEALLPLLHDDMKKAAALAEEVIQSFNAFFQQAWLVMMMEKLGMFGKQEEDDQLVGDLLQLMQRYEMDYTNTFYDLANKEVPEGKHYQAKAFQDWWQQWHMRLKQQSNSFEDSLQRMQANNPVVIPRNHRVEEVLSAATEQEDFATLYTLLDVLSNPYQKVEKYHEFQTPPKPGEIVAQTFCGT